MSDELKLCPHCGSESLLVIARRTAIQPRLDAKVFEGRVLCEECGGTMLLNHATRADVPDDVGEIEMREVLRDRWNTRAAVTDEQFAVAVHDGRVWQVVRECHDAGTSDNFFRCSNCGCEIMRCVDGWRPLYMGEINFCPNCGSKVAG